jgi:hypothetical protein
VANLSRNASETGFCAHMEADRSTTDSTVITDFCIGSSLQAEQCN